MDRDELKLEIIQAVIVNICWAAARLWQEGSEDRGEVTGKSGVRGGNCGAFWRRLVWSWFLSWSLPNDNIRTITPVSVVTIAPPSHIVRSLGISVPILVITVVDPSIRIEGIGVPILAAALVAPVVRIVCIGVHLLVVAVGGGRGGGRGRG